MVDGVPAPGVEVVLGLGVAVVLPAEDEGGEGGAAAAAEEDGVDEAREELGVDGASVPGAHAEVVEDEVRRGGPEGAVAAGEPREDDGLSEGEAGGEDAVEDLVLELAEPVGCDRDGVLVGGGGGGGAGRHCFGGGGLTLGVGWWSEASRWRETLWG